MLFFCLSVLTRTENGGESITKSGQESIVQVSFKDLP